MKEVREFQIVGDGEDMFIVVDGLKIAKRGHPGTRHAGTCISLEPGWTVTSSKKHEEIEIAYDGAEVH